MRSKIRSRLDLIAIGLPLGAYITVIVGLYLVIRPQDLLNLETPTGILTALITLIVAIPVIASSLVPVLVRRDTDQEVAANLHAELEGVKESLHHNGNCKYNGISPLHHKVFDSLVSSGMISHVNPKYVYDVEDVYSMIENYNEKYTGKCKPEHNKAESQKTPERSGGSGEQQCQSKDGEARSRKDYEEYLKCRIGCISAKLKKNTKDR